MHTFIVNQNDTGQSLFKFLKKVFPDTKLSIIYKLLRTKSVKVNGKRIKDRDFILQCNDEVVVYDKQLTPVARDWFEPLADVNLTVVYEDNNILIVDKPHHVQMHSPNVEEPSMDNQVKTYLFRKGEYDPATENSFIVSHVHRLDRMTRGLVIYAKNKLAQDYFTAAIADKDRVEKHYLAWVTPVPKQPVFSIRGWIHKDERLQRMVVTKQQQYATDKEVWTEFRVKSQNGHRAWLDVQLMTGRKHQIRASLASYGITIINDIKYGATRDQYLDGIALYAYELKFKNFTGEFSYLNEKSFKINLEGLSA